MMTKLHCGILAAFMASAGALTVGCDETTTTGTSSSSSSGSGGSAGEGGMAGNGGAAGGGAGGGGMGGTGGVGGGGSGGGMMAVPDLDTNLMWYGENRKALDEMIDQVGVNSANYDPNKKPVAIYDWDNTVIKNDIGDIMFFYQVKNDKIIQPPNKDWTTTSRYLTTEAANALAAACGSLAAAGMPLPTSTNAACADELVAVYTTAKTTAGAAAYSGWNYRTMEPAYAWVAQLQAGFTTDELKGFAKTALDAALAETEGATQTVGTTSVNAWLRIYAQIANLIDVMQKNGIDVWVISASSQPIVEAFAEKVNIAADHVIGIRTVKDAMGKHTYDIVGCGSVPDGSGNGSGNPLGNTMISYIEGKRCWMNTVIYGESGAAAEMTNPDMAKRPVFGAGDSDTDISFLHDATHLKLVINRNKNEIMCNGYANHDKKWIINPMFIQPKGQYAAGYPCSTTACKDEAGASVPCTNELKEIIADQTDTVY
ncbi:MAG: haloacid dehalogenase-like hydrolase [Polyangiaceae bacterium]|nr:haloacid dehalogenase-like hydrolase [Polyangiaceae bacterium]